MSDMPERCEQNIGRIDRLSDTMYGNGTDGVLTKIGKLSVQTKIVLSLQIAQFIAVVGWMIKNGS